MLPKMAVLWPCCHPAQDGCPVAMLPPCPRWLSCGHVAMLPKMAVLWPCCHPAQDGCPVAMLPPCPIWQSCGHVATLPKMAVLWPCCYPDQNGCPMAMLSVMPKIHSSVLFNSVVPGMTHWVKDLSWGWSSLKLL
jgi:hypothetical protein